MRALLAPRCPPHAPQSSAVRNGEFVVVAPCPRSSTTGAKSRVMPIVVRMFSAVRTCSSTDIAESRSNSVGGAERNSSGRTASPSAPGATERSAASGPSIQPLSSAQPSAEPTERSGARSEPRQARPERKRSRAVRARGAAPGRGRSSIACRGDSSTGHESSPAPAPSGVTRAATPKKPANPLVP